MARKTKSFYPSDSIHCQLVDLFGEDYGSSEIGKMVELGILSMSDEGKSSGQIKEEINSLYREISKKQAILPVIIEKEGCSFTKREKEIKDRTTYFNQLWIKLGNILLPEDKLAFINLEIEKNNNKEALLPELIKIRGIYLK